MPKIRHIAYRADDVEAMASFFAKGFEMSIVRHRKNGAIDLSDGTINITILPAPPPVDGQPRRHGLDHIGFMAEDENLTSRLLESAGAQKLDATSTTVEVKFRGPEGIRFDVGHWAGAAPVETDKDSKSNMSQAKLLT